MQKRGQGDGISFKHSNFMSHNFQTLKSDKDLHFLHYNTVYNLHVIVLFKHASIIIMDVAFWHHTKIIYKMSFLLQIWPTSSLTAIVSVLAVSFVVVCCFGAQVRVSLYIFFNTNYHLFLPHNYTITTVYK